MTQERRCGIFLGVSLKMYMDHRTTLDWARRVVGIADGDRAVQNGSVSLAIMPEFVSLDAVARITADSKVQIGAQDLSWDDHGAYTGEVSGHNLAAIGCRYAVVGHAERRRLFGENDAVVAAKVAAAVRAGLVPLLCVGEQQVCDRADAMGVCRDQLLSAIDELGDDHMDRLDGGGRSGSTRGGSPGPDLIVAYEPVWAIGAARPASSEHVAAVCEGLRAELEKDHRTADPRVIYGGSAGPGTLTELASAVDGLFLGRFAHDPDAFAKVITEAGGLL